MSIARMMRDEARIWDTSTQTVSESGFVTEENTWTNWVPCYIAEPNENNVLPSELQFAFSEFYIVLVDKDFQPKAGQTIDLRYSDGTVIGELPIESVTIGRKRHSTHHWRIMAKKVQ